MLFSAFTSGVIAGAILAFLSHIAPLFGAKNFIRDLDQPRLFGRNVTRREAHFVGLFVHLMLSGLFALIYAGLVQYDILSGFQLLPLLGWSVVLYLFMGGIILPLEGHGLFGVKEDSWFPVDLFLTNAAWAILFWWMMQLWPRALDLF